MFVTHRLHTVQRFPRVVLLDHGRVAYDGPPAGLPQRLANAASPLELDAPGTEDGEMGP